MVPVINTLSTPNDYTQDDDKIQRIRAKRHRLKLREEENRLKMTTGFARDGDGEGEGEGGC